MPTPSLPQWHLKERMALSGLRTVASLRDALAGKGISLSAVQVGRLVRVPPERLGLRQLTALCELLQCTPNDLLTIPLVPKQADPAAPARHPTIPATRAPSRYLQSMSPEDRQRLIGPPARALSANPLSKKS